MEREETKMLDQKKKKRNFVEKWKSCSKADIDRPYVHTKNDLLCIFND